MDERESFSRALRGLSKFLRRAGPSPRLKALYSAFESQSYRMQSCKHAQLVHIWVMGQIDIIKAPIVCTRQMFSVVTKSKGPDAGGGTGERSKFTLP